MMKRLLTLAALVASAPAYAQDFDPRDPVTGNGLLAICSLDDPVSRTACGLYIRGLDHMLNTLQVHGQVREIDCSPDSSTSNQKRDVFIGYLKANPQTRHLGSPLLFMRAMAEAFSCSMPQARPRVDKRF
ncbi:MAG: hypothetical protein EPO41_23335 [Reyranella sp.]|uniref:Rap1a/Tai family immunity protein n=1 Tax=Reyranella sp. TaxID=1929291 RepID=UPI0011FE5334|nr:Rap1a/Tai family immunity protein [Reyranella sp.]TAJ87277.1 MAG: hypothetical protein EPO41_23335 [Reyranella sp.]